MTLTTEERLEKVKGTVQSGVVQKEPELKKEPEQKKRIIDLDQFAVELDQGFIIQVYKKNREIVIDMTPLLGRWMLFSIVIIALLGALLVTKMAGLW